MYSEIIKKMLLGILVIAMAAGSISCTQGGNGGAGGTEMQSKVIVSAYIDGQQTPTFRAWGWDSGDNYAEDQPSGDQRAFLYFPLTGQIKVCAKYEGASVSKKCKYVDVSAGVPEQVSFYFQMGAADPPDSRTE